MLLALVGHVQAVGLLQRSLQRGRGEWRERQKQREAGRVRQMQREAQREHETDTQTGVGVPGERVWSHRGCFPRGLGPSCLLPVAGAWLGLGGGRERRGSWTREVWMPLCPPPGLWEHPPPKLTKAQDTGRMVKHRLYPDKEIKAQSKEDPGPHLLISSTPGANSQATCHSCASSGLRSRSPRLCEVSSQCPSSPGLAQSFPCPLSSQRSRTPLCPNRETEAQRREVACQTRGATHAL